MTINIQATFSHQSYPHDKVNTTHLVVSLQAPAKDGVQRPTLCVVPVIDCSGSMMGQPLEGAKRSVLQMIDHLRDGDYCGLVTFSSTVTVVFPAQRITPQNREALKTAVQRLQAGGNTNFAGGMLKAFELVDNLDLPVGVLRRVIMLTDGQANCGPAVAPDDIVKLLVNANSTTVSAFGYGHGVSQDFLTTLAQSGQGSYATIDDPDKSLVAFGRELGGLISTYATDLVLDLEPQAGHTIRRVLSSVDHEFADVGKDLTIRVPALLAEEKLWVVLEVDLAEQKQAFPRPVGVVNLHLRYSTLKEDGRVASHKEEVRAKVLFTKEGVGSPIPEVVRHVDLALLAHAQRAAEVKAGQGDLKGAFTLMADAQASLNTADVAAFSGKLRQQYASPEAYRGSVRYRASVGMGLGRGAGVALYDAGAQADLSSLSVSVGTQAMTEVGQSFATSTPAPTPTFTVPRKP